MADSQNKKAVGYIRAAVWKKNWAPDYEIQGAALNKYMKDNRYEKVKTAIESQSYKQTHRKANLALKDLLEICEKENADFLYCDTGMSRTNPFFKQVVYERSFAKGGWKFIKLPKDEILLDAIRRFNRLDFIATRNYQRLNPPIKKEKKSGIQNMSSLDRWVIANDISPTRLKNYVHLVGGAYSIFDVISEHIENGLANKAIAWELNNLLYFTPTEKPWTEESVRKLRNMIKGKYESKDHFRSFISAWKDRRK